MVASLLFVFEGQRVKAPTPSPPTVEAAIRVATTKLGIPVGSCDLYDTYGKIEASEDLARAISMSSPGDTLIEVREHDHYRRIRALEAAKLAHDGRLDKIEAVLKEQEKKAQERLQVAKDEAKSLVSKLEKRINDELKPVVDNLVRDKTRLQKDVRAIEEKLGELDVEELKEMATTSKVLRDEVKDSVRRVADIQRTIIADKAKLLDMCQKNSRDLLELQRYLQGKIDVCIEADADIRREQQLCSERMQILADDLRLLADDHSRLAKQAAQQMEEEEELRTMFVQLKEENDNLKLDHNQVKVRVGCVELRAKEAWEGFMPGVVYYKQFHRNAKGGDVQLSKDLFIATGRGWLAQTGLITGNNEGLCVGDGPCRRYGTPGIWSSYFEIEVEEIRLVPDGMGGLWVGVSVNTGEEIASHPNKEFDGWLLGGPSKAMVCRAGTHGHFDPERLPGTFAPNATQTSGGGTFTPGASMGPGAFDGNIVTAVQALRAAMPPRAKGDMREFASQWDSSTLERGDIVGVLFRCNKDAGARMRVSVNGKIVATQDFVDAPPASAIGFLTPVIRLAGAGKSVRLLPGQAPSAQMLAK